MIKLVVFDFDGTLADTKSLLLKLITDEGYIKLNDEMKRDFGNLPFNDTLIKLGIEQKVLPSIAAKVKLDLKREAKKVALVTGIASLENIRKPKIVLSNSVTLFIKEVLRDRGINFFDAVYGSEFFASKEGKFKEILREYKTKPSEVVYVGDRPVDCELAKRMKCICVLISQKASWSPVEDLLEAKQDYLISSLADLRKIIDSLDSV